MLFAKAAIAQDESYYWQWAVLTRTTNPFSLKQVGGLSPGTTTMHQPSKFNQCHDKGITYHLNRPTINHKNIKRIAVLG
jgi:hypothetical protein